MRHLGHLAWHLKRVGQSFNLYKNDTNKQSVGTIIYDTKYVKDRNGLPDGYVVIKYEKDDYCICLDCNNMNADGECPVVEYNVYKKQIEPKALFNTFEEYLIYYLENKLDTYEE